MTSGFSPVACHGGPARGRAAGDRVVGPAAAVGERSTFTDLTRAEAAIAEALARSADAVRAFAAGSAPPDLNVVAKLQRGAAETLLRADGSWGLPQLVHVLLRRDEHGNVHVHTAMLRETWHR